MHLLYRVLALLLLGAQSAFALTLYDPEQGTDGWRQIAFSGHTVYRRVDGDSGPALSAHAEGAASMLIREVTVDPKRCPILHWSWRVTALPVEADIRYRQREDVGASLYLLFGPPPSLFASKPPTLRYVWGAGAVAVGSLVDSPYAPGVERSIVIRSGQPGTAWHWEKRDLIADFTRAFGAPPSGPIRALAVFTDSDQTGGVAQAEYGPINLICPVD